MTAKQFALLVHCSNKKSECQANEKLKDEIIQKDRLLQIMRNRIQAEKKRRTNYKKIRRD
jgi:hypothetical protein